MPVDPLEEPGPPVSCTLDQPLKACIWLTTSALEGTIDSGLAEPALTVITTDVTHAPPFPPHAFTCKVCVPMEDETALLID
jgi:hypothetical protein